MTFRRIGGNESMHGPVTDQEWQIFKEAYLYFEAHCDPPANQAENACDWWSVAANDVAEVDNRWNGYPLMRELLLAIYNYLDYKAKERTKELADFSNEELV